MHSTQAEVQVTPPITPGGRARPAPVYVPRWLMVAGACCATAGGVLGVGALDDGHQGTVARVLPEPGEDPGPMTPAEERAIGMAADLSSAFRRVARDLTPTVVSIAATSSVDAGAQGQSPADELFRQFFGPRAAPPVRRAPRTVTSTGSGFIVSADGYILTNNHVIENADSVTVTLSDQRQLEATVVGADPGADLAVLKITPPGTYPFARLGDSDATEVGDWVVAIGNPFGLNHTVTAGIISAKGRRINERGPTGAVNLTEFLQTDAAINPGNSGGPMVDLQGRVIGIATAIFTRSGGYQGIGLGIPANLASDVFDDILKNGSFERGYLGLTQLEEVTPEYAQILGIDTPRGALIAEIVPGTPAHDAGLRTDDVIVSLNGRPTPDPEQLVRIAGRLRAGSTAAVQYLRNGKPLSTTVTFAALGAVDDAIVQHAAAQEAQAADELGLVVRQVGARDALRLSDPGALGGVRVVNALRDSPAIRLGGLQRDDVIVRVNGTPVRSAEDYAKALRSVQPERGVRLVIRRNGQESVRTFQDQRFER
ncbi:MAG: hypothetical protein C0513_03245 [Isosphaera sp.]|nr:hypothetical protein [Isosphaera sp.]